jgi:hypothetical protein
VDRDRGRAAGRRALVLEQQRQPAPGELSGDPDLRARLRRRRVRHEQLHAARERGGAGDVSIIVRMHEGCATHRRRLRNTE